MTKYQKCGKRLLFRGVFNIRPGIRHCALKKGHQGAHQDRHTKPRKKRGRETFETVMDAEVYRGLLFAGGILESSDLGIRLKTRFPNDCAIRVTVERIARKGGKGNG